MEKNGPRPGEGLTDLTVGSCGQRERWGGHRRPIQGYALFIHAREAEKCGAVIL